MLALKGEIQGTLHDDVIRFLDDPPPARNQCRKQACGRCGSRPHRDLCTATISTPTIDWLQEDHQWLPGCRRQSGTHPGNRHQDDDRDGAHLISTALSSERFNEVARSHLEQWTGTGAGCCDEREDQGQTRWATGRTISPCCGISRSTSCRRIQARNRCAASSCAPGMIATLPGYWRCLEMRLPWWSAFPNTDVAPPPAWPRDGASGRAGPG